MAQSVKYIFVLGGVMSGVGKGTASASIANILQSRGMSVTAIKIDPYINVDAGTMNPVEHGEVFVTTDGDETDQDIGTYERFLNQDITSLNYMTTGRVYQTVIEKERNLEYAGKCVEVVPHVPEEIIRRINAAAKAAKADIVLIEVGGTVGEYQNILFLEAARMIKLKKPKDVLFALVSYLPVPGKIGEMKTKPTQYAARTLNSAGIQADIIIARSEVPIDEPRKKKLALFCGVDEADVISAPDVESIYDIPLNFEANKLSDRILKRFGLRARGRDMGEWEAFVGRMKSAKKEKIIAIIGKYFSTGDFVLSDSYLSVIEAIKHAAWAQGVKPKLLWLNSEAYEQDPGLLAKELAGVDGIIIPGGFGTRGVEGKIKAIRFAREKGIPYLGLCYGMQLAVVEYARHVAGLNGANTTEIDPATAHPVIHIMEGQKQNVRSARYGGTLRLGSYPCVLDKKSHAYQLYGKEVLIHERHRHRYEFNNEYRELLQDKGMLFSGVSPDGALVEMIEISNHPFFVGVQFHPEFLSRPLHPHPLFMGFVKALKGKK